MRHFYRSVELLLKVQKFRKKCENEPTHLPENMDPDPVDSPKSNPGGGSCGAGPSGLPPDFRPASVTIKPTPSSRSRELADAILHAASTLKWGPRRPPAPVPPARQPSPSNGIPSMESDTAFR
jgi:hypothetical protein